MAPFLDNFFALRCQLPLLGCALLSLNHLERTFENISKGRKGLKGGGGWSLKQKKGSVIRRYLKDNWIPVVLSEKTPIILQLIGFYCPSGIFFCVEPHPDPVLVLLKGLTYACAKSLQIVARGSHGNWFSMQSINNPCTWKTSISARKILGIPSSSYVIILHHVIHLQPEMEQHRHSLIASVKVGHSWEMEILGCFQCPPHQCWDKPLRFLPSKPSKKVFTRISFS